MKSIILFSTLLLLLCFFISSSSSSTFIALAQQEEPATISRDIFCGMNDETLEDTNFILRVVSNATKGGTEENPCPLLHISNKNIRKIEFGSFHVTNVVIRDSHFYDLIYLYSTVVFGNSNVNAGGDSSSRPSILIDNVIFDYYKNGQTVRVPFSLLRISQPIESTAIIDSVTIANSKFTIDVDFDSAGQTTSFGSSVTTPRILTVNQINIRSKLEIANNSVHTTFGGMGIDLHCAGKVIISNNKIDRVGKYSSAVDEFGTYMYQPEFDSMLLVDFTSLPIHGNPISSSPSLVGLYILNNNITDIRRHHNPRFMDPLVFISPNISSAGKELLVENNRFVVDGDQLSLLPRSEAAQITHKNNISEVYRMLSFGGDEGKFRLVNVDRFIIRKNYFFARLFKTVRGISTVDEMITMCSAGEDNFFEISQNTFDLSTKTRAIANANIGSLTAGERLVLLKMTDSIRAMSISSGNCHKFNISSNVIERIEMFKPILFSPFSGEMFDTVGAPIATMYIFDVGNHGGMKEFFANNNIFGFVINVDDSLLGAVTGLIIREDKNRPVGQTFTTLSRLEMRGNNISCIGPSSITTFGFLSFVDDLTHLDTLILENNIIDVSLLTKIVSCAFCVDDNVIALVNLLSIIDPTGALQMREAIAASKTPGIYGFFCPSTGRLSPLASSTQLSYSVRSNVFTAPMPSSSQESPQAIFALFYYPNPFHSSSTGTVSRKKSLIFENNTFNVITVHEEVNYFLSTSLFTLFAAVEFTTLRVNNNKHIFVNTDHGTASSFQFWQMNAVDSTTTRSFEFKGNQVIRRRRIASNQQQQQSSSSLSYYRLVGFENVSSSVSSVWQLVSPLSAAPPTSRMIFLNKLTSTPSPSTSSSSSHQLLVSNNFIDMNNGTAETDNLMIHFDNSDSNFFNDVQIMNNNIHFSHDRAQTCALITGLKTGQLLKIGNNQIDFAKCQKTSSILNATTIGGTVSLSSNKLNCGTQCLFASIDQIAPSSTLTMKSNQMTLDKETECDDEQRYLKLQQSSSSSSTSSFSIDVSSDVFETNCNEITYTRNGEARILNVSALKSIASVNDANCQVLTKCQDERDEPPLLSSAAAIVVSDEVSAALTTNDVVQSFSMASMAIGAASTPTLGFSVARQQAMMNYAQNALKGDCRGLLPATKTSGEEDSENENPLGAADSPTRMQIGDSVAAAFVGAVIGNFILFCGLILLNQLVGHLVTKIIIAKYFSVPSNMKLAFMFSKTKKKEYEQQQDRWKDPKYVFVNSFVSLSLFYLVALLLSPTLTSAVVVVAGVSNEIVPVGIKILCLIIAFIIAGVGVYFIIWSTFIRKPRREEYRITNHEEVKEQNKKKEIGVLDMLKKYCKADGEWKIPINKRTQRENDEFQIAEPCFTSYRKNQWFAVVEIITSVLLCLPPLFAQLGSSGKSSCVIHGSLLFVILLVYTILLIWKNPKKIPAMRLVFPMMAIQQTVTAGMTLIAVVTRDDNENDQSTKAHEETWLWKTIFVPMGFSVFLGILVMLVSISPMLTFFYKLRQRLAKAQQQQNGRRSGEKQGTKREKNSNSYNNNDDDDDLEMNLVERKNNNNHHHGDGRRRESRDDKRHHSRHGSRNDQRNHSGSRKEHTTTSSLSSPHRHHHHRRNNDNDDDHHHRRRDHHSSLSNSNHHRHHSSSASRYHNDRDRQNHHNRRPSSSRNEEDRRNHRETRYHHHHHHDRRSPGEGDRNKTEDRRREGDSSRRREQHSHSNRHQDLHGQSRSTDVRRSTSSDGGRHNNNSRDRRYRDKLKRDPML